MMSGRRWAGPVRLGLCSLLAATAVSAAERVQLPPGRGCSEIISREECCLFVDGRIGTPYSGQECVPSSADVPYVEAYGNVCEPKCWVDGSCNDDLEIASRAGTCEAPLPPPVTAVATTTTPTKVEESLNTTTTATTVATTSTTTHTTQALGDLYLEQVNATVPVGGELSFFIVASSTGAWQTWPDQLHATLKGMGYSVSVPEPTYPGWLAQPTNKPICLDDADYADLATPRFGMVGWSSWGFAFDDQEDCNAEGYRPVLQYNISCTNAWACNYAWRNRDADYLSAAKMAQTFKGLKFVVLSNWINDAKTCDSNSARDACIPGADIEGLGSTAITSYTVPKLINKIHQADPEVVVLVLARYADTSKTIYVNTRTLDKVAELNAGVKAAVQDLPNTYFVDISFPLDVNMFQTKSKVHPNCRGDKVIVNSIIEALYDKQVISRGLTMAGEECLPRTDCEELSYACCHKSALCYVKDGKCSPYTPGLQ
mmetsp:Transcript_46828/g.100849  ORF Transcript_46828/g.100849 Transcript_46828/m.100849 type:complete len:485 (+) Transcript_46828:110-1564(+)